ncbi:MAG: hypothetical protein ABI972_02770 [Acidobacteriota bacterium]
MRLLGAFLLFSAALCAQDSAPPPNITRALDRLSEEAEAFFQKAPRIIGRETLTHKGRLGRPRIRWGNSSGAPEVRYFTREIASEYGFAALKDKPEWIREFRQVVAVDGRNILASNSNPRQALAEGMTNEDDRRRMNLLRDFEKYGQVGAATDFGQSILYFRTRAMPYCDFQFLRQEFSGADEVYVIEWRQKAGSPDAASVYSERKLDRVRMEGQLFIRASDGILLKIILGLRNTEYDSLVTHAAEITYARSRYGVLLPSSVKYRKIAQQLIPGKNKKDPPTPGQNKKDPPTPGQPLLMIDNLALYTDWQMFAADAEIKFTPVEGDQPKQ